MRAWPAGCAVSIAAILGSHASAAKVDRAETTIGRCIEQAAKGRPWLARTLWGLRDSEGGWRGAEVANTNGTHDLGPLQINSSWIPKLAKMVRRPKSDVRFWLIHDVCFNVAAARWLFLSELGRTRDYWKAVGAYHSPTGWRQAAYAAQVASKMERRHAAHLLTRNTSLSALKVSLSATALAAPPQRAEHNAADACLAELRCDREGGLERPASISPTQGVPP